ncbi:MAG: cytochrome c [Arenicellales bacterium]
MKAIVVSSLLAGLLATAGAGHGQMGMMQGGGSGISFIRHQFVMQHGIDPDYASKENPLEASDDNLEAGKKLYDQNCSACHGPSGLGDGVAGKQLKPPPSNIAASTKMGMSTDGYLYWTIAEGGVPLHTAMPAFKGALKEDQIWQIILYIRQL